MGANGGENIFEHLCRQSPCVGVVARAVIAVEQIKIIVLKRMLGAMAKGGALFSDAEGGECRIMGNAPKTQNCAQIFHLIDLGAQKMADTL